jgi:hypothetical protein
MTKDGHTLWSFGSSAPDQLAEPGLRILKFPPGIMWAVAGSGDGRVIS